MVTQIALGAGLIILTTLIAGIGFLTIEAVLTRLYGWLLRPPHAPRVILLLCLSVTWLLTVMLVAVFLWALVFEGLGLFADFRQAFYFAIVAFTTLGFGDLLLPRDWQILAGMISINGLLMIGLQTAMLIEILRRVRLEQTALRGQGR